MADLTICPREDCTATYRHWHTPTAGVPVECSCLPDACTHTGTPAATSCHEPRPQADLTEPVDLPTATVWHVDSRTVPKPEDPRVERAAQALYEAERDSTRPGWQDVTDKTRDKHLKRARVAVTAIDEAVKSDD